MFHLLPTVCSAFILILGPAKISNILLEHTFPNTVVLTLVSALQKGKNIKPESPFHHMSQKHIPFKYRMENIAGFAPCASYCPFKIHGC